MATGKKIGEPVTLATFLTYLPLVRDALSRLGKDQTEDEVEHALKVAFDYQQDSKTQMLEWLGRIPQLPEESARFLLDFDFKSLTTSLGELLEEIEFDEFLDIDIPGARLLLTEQEVKCNGEIWTIHRYDADPFPHLVHAHSYQRRVKLDLRNGHVYNKAKCCLGKLKFKELLEIREKVTHPDLPPLDVDLQ